ncbi:hypothetical protein LRB_783 [Ligilactobacillus ruminis]|uniref:Uncharacterized protein n=1 Tax=Ligilactobacillus ruminis TaxID=1623 RepID=A0A837IRV8_9LACO|nr:hypothetical protein LRB_783 [Ligilactobacillus ruminis]
MSLCRERPVRKMAITDKMDKNGRLSVKFQLAQPRKQNKITKI